MLLYRIFFQDLVYVEQALQLNIRKVEHRCSSMCCSRQLHDAKLPRSSPPGISPIIQQIAVSVLVPSDNHIGLEMSILEYLGLI